MVTLITWLPVDVLKGQLWDVDLFTLQWHLPVLLYDLGALIACVQVRAAHVVYITARFATRRLLITLFNRDTLRNLR